MTTTQTVHHYFSGPMMEMTIGPNIVLTVGRASEVHDPARPHDSHIAVVVRVAGELTSYVTLPKDEFIRAAEVVRTLL